MGKGEWIGISAGAVLVIGGAISMWRAIRDIYRSLAKPWVIGGLTAIIVGVAMIGRFWGQG